MAFLTAAEVERLRAMTGHELEKYVSHHTALDGLFGFTNVDWRDEVDDVPAVKSLLTGNAAATSEALLHRHSRVAGLFSRFKLVQWCIDRSLPCQCAITILDNRGLLGLPGTFGKSSHLSRTRDVQDLYYKPTSENARPFRRALLDRGALAYVDEATAQKWAEAGIQVSRLGVISATEFNKCARAYSQKSIEVAAVCLVGMKRARIEERITVVPLCDDV